MAHWIDELEELCERVTESIAEANDELRKDNGKLSTGDAEYIDKLTHILKSIKTTIAMEDYDDGYSRDGGSYARGGRSYARGRGRNARRDSMGRYSRGGYSYDEKETMIDEIKEIMKDAPDEKTRQEFHRFVKKLEDM